MAIRFALSFRSWLLSTRLDRAGMSRWNPYRFGVCVLDFILTNNFNFRLVLAGTQKKSCAVEETINYIDIVLDAVVDHFRSSLRLYHVHWAGGWGTPFYFVVPIHILNRIVREFSDTAGLFLFLSFVLFGHVDLPLTVAVLGVRECHASYVLGWLGLQPKIVSSPICGHNHRRIQASDTRLYHENGS